MGGGIFVEARDYCAENHVPYGTYFPVLDENGECVYLLHYLENRIYTDLHLGGVVQKWYFKYGLENNEMNLDYTLVESAGIYVFSELEEYTYAIAMILAKKYPEKSIIFLDERISYFPELVSVAICMKPIDIYEMSGEERYLWVISEGILYEAGNTQDFLQKEKGMLPEHWINVYNSINVMYSIFWCSIKECFGAKNNNCTILVCEFSNKTAGLADYIKFVFACYSLAKKRKWKFVIDLSHKPNQYLMSETENMWDYFFETLSDIPIEEAYESASVIRTSINGMEFYEWAVLPYYRIRTWWNSEKVMSNIKFNKETRAEIDKLMPKILKKNNEILGVILRGTDFRKEAREWWGKGKRIANIDKVIQKCKFLMELYGYSHIFLATEDSKYFERMKEEFGDRCLSIDQKRVYHDYRKGYKACSELLDLEDGKSFGRRYLAISQSLANCKSLISNTYCGICWIAEGLNNSQYEYFEVVTP